MTPTFRLLCSVILSCAPLVAGTYPVLGQAAPNDAIDPDTAFTPFSASDVTLEQFVWNKRPVVVFADSASDPAFRDQMQALSTAWPDLRARDVVVITDTDPAALTSVRRALRPRGFSIVVLEKDGSVAQRKPSPRDGREISRAIDKMPIRREEIRNAPTTSLRTGS